MKILILMIFLSLMSACSTSLVNVDFDSCQQRGTLDGVKVSQCKVVKNVK